MLLIWTCECFINDEKQIEKQRPVPERDKHLTSFDFNSDEKGRPMDDITSKIRNVTDESIETRADAQEMRMWLEEVVDEGILNKHDGSCLINIDTYDAIDELLTSFKGKYK